MTENPAPTNLPPLLDTEATGYGDPNVGVWDADPRVCCAAFHLGACEHTEVDQTRVTLRITPAVAAEYDTREMAASYVGDANAYAVIDGPGSYDFTPDEARELLADALHYSEAGGPGDALTVGQRSAYRMLAGQILRTGVR